MKPERLRPACLAVGAALLLALAPARAIVGGTPTTGFAAIGTGVQVTPDWVLTVEHAVLNPGSLYDNGYGPRVVAARYSLPGTTGFPQDDFALLRLEPLATAAPVLAVNGTFVPAGSFAPLPVTIASAFLAQVAVRNAAPTTITASVQTADPDGGGPLQPVPVNWLVSWDAVVHVESGDSGGGLFLGHVADSSVLLGLSSELLTDDHGAPTGSAFVQPAAYRAWIDATMAADLADSQAVLWVDALAVPEPAPWLLAAAGLLGLAAHRRRP